MLLELKKKAIKVAAIRALICIGVVIGVLVFTNFGILNKIQGPVDLESISIDDYKKQYVKTEMNLSLGIFIEEISKNTQTNKESIISNYYIIPVNNEVLIGISIPKDEIETANRIVEETYDFFEGYSDSIATSLEIKGMLAPMEDEEWKYFVRTLESMGYRTEEINEIAVPYVLKQGYLGNTREDITVILTIVSLLAILYAIYSLIMAFSGAYQKGLMKYIDKNESVAKEQVEIDFSEAECIDKRVWVGQRWTIYLAGATAKIIENQEIVWAYYKEVTRVRKGATTTFRDVILYNKEKDMSDIKVLSEQSGHRILEIYKTNQRHIVCGYNKELEKCFRKDYDRFLTLASENDYNTEMDRANEI